MQDYQEEILQISTLRETKGKEQETLDKISELLPQLIQNNLWELVAKLHWESHLVWQHKAMSELAKPVELRNLETIKEGTAKMSEFAEKALEVIKDHRLNDMLGKAFKFLGRAATFSGNHKKAREFYENAIKNYSDKDFVFKLEANGFLAECLVRLGQPEKGLTLARKTFDDFHNSELGKNLKNSDFFTWAVWMSGIPPRIINALLDTGAKIDKPQMLLWLEKVENELKNPEYSVKWGDGKFEFRIDEIRAVSKKLVGSE